MTDKKSKFADLADFNKPANEEWSGLDLRWIEDTRAETRKPAVALKQGMGKNA